MWNVLMHDRSEQTAAAALRAATPTSITISAPEACWVAGSSAHRNFPFFMKRSLFKSVILALGAFALGLIHPAAAQPVTLKHSISAPLGTQSGAQLGYAV